MKTNTEIAKDILIGITNFVIAYVGMMLFVLAVVIPIAMLLVVLMVIITP